MTKRKSGNAKAVTLQQPSLMCAHCRAMIPLSKLNKHIAKDHGEEKQGKER